MASIPASEWLDMMSDTVVINAWVSQNGAGVPTYSGTSTSYPAYIEMANHVVVNGHGREVLAIGKVFLASTGPISAKDKVTLPAGTVPLSPPIIAVDSQNDENGTHHLVLHIGAA